MGLLRAEKKRKISHLGELGISDPLRVAPAAESDVEARSDEKNLLQLRRRFQPTGRLYGWVARRLKYRHDVRVNLDERGTFFWRQMDGNRTLGRIAGALAARFELQAGEAREAVVLFTKMLMTRRLIYLVVPKTSGTAAKA